MKALGLTHGGIYSHFKAKDELLEKALQTAVDELDAHCAISFAEEFPLEASNNGTRPRPVMAAPPDNVFRARPAPATKPNHRCRTQRQAGTNGRHA